MRVKSIKKTGKVDVFNLEVEDTHNFVIQGGIVSHNCADEVRYMCMLNPIAPRETITIHPPDSDPLNMWKDAHPDDTYTFFRI